ncbi:MAG TPA: TIGR03943 family protein, partial [Caldilineaceae bacterium]|nr:TIGR03943 family protein [Caldilineaceae bacterium]
MRPRFETTLKALLLIALGLFLYSRLANGTLYFYINRRFMAFTLLAVFGLIVVGLSYRFKGRHTDESPHDHDHDHTHEHNHDPDHAGHQHSHGLTWGGVVLLLLPIVLGLIVPPQPLGASAFANREVNAGLNPGTMPGILGTAKQKTASDKNILDWWESFRASSNLAADQSFIGQPAKVVGFIYKDQRYGAGHFMVVRYLVSCCVADASALGLVVAWPEEAQLKNDQWV